MSAKDIIRIFVSVHKCAGCGEILDAEHSGGAFCASCQLAWNASLTESCKNCFKPAIECDCVPKTVSKSGALCMRRLFFYKSENTRAPQMSIIYWLKYKKSKRIVSFVANELYSTVKGELEILELGIDDVIVCGVPRSKKARIKHGFDQSEMVAKKLAELLGLKYSRLLDTSIVRKAQKELNRRQRLANAKKSIKLCKNADVSEKYVVLLDDMVTTGASMAACADLLRKNGCKGVLCFSLASTQKM